MFCICIAAAAFELYIVPDITAVPPPPCGRMGHPFELPLLAQSVIMNVVMLLLVHVCVTVKARQQIVKHKERTFTGTVRGTLSVGGELETRGHPVCGSVGRVSRSAVCGEWLDTSFVTMYIWYFSTCYNRCFPIV